VCPCLTETLRKYPPVPAVTRECTKTTKLAGTDITVEKGIQLVLPILALHHDPKYYPDPERFDPERFSEEEKKKRPQFSYLPFGEGPRLCIGELSF
jgi:cytochrome P450 family 6